MSAPAYPELPEPAGEHHEGDGSGPLYQCGHYTETQVHAAIDAARAQDRARAAAPICATCNDNGVIGGPSFQEPGEGGVPCPDCEDLILVPRGLIGAACSAINKKRDAPKLLDELRRHTIGDLSAAAPQAADPMNYQGMFLEAVKALAEIDQLLGLPEDGCNDPQVTVSALKDYIAGAKETAAYRDQWVDAQYAAPPPAVGVSDGQIETIALARYKVVPAHGSMFWSHAVVAGDGTQQLYTGREVECQNMAAKFTGAFLDGAFLALSPATKPEAPAVPDMRAICEALGVDPTNHHNAAKCPYCRPAEAPANEGDLEPIASIAKSLMDAAIAAEGTFIGAFGGDGGLAQLKAMARDLGIHAVLAAPAQGAAVPDAERGSPAYINSLADIVDPKKLWQWSGVDQLPLTDRERYQLDAGVYLRRHAAHIERLRGLIGTGQSLLLTPLSPHGTSVRCVDTPEDVTRIVALRAARQTATQGADHEQQ